MAFSAALAGWCGTQCNISGYQTVSVAVIASIAGSTSVPFNYGMQVLVAISTELLRAFWVALESRIGLLLVLSDGPLCLPVITYLPIVSVRVVCFRSFSILVVFGKSFLLSLALCFVLLCFLCNSMLLLWLCAHTTTISNSISTTFNYTYTSL